MERRQFLIGLGAGAVGGAALTAAGLARVRPKAAQPAAATEGGRQGRVSFSAMGEDLIVAALLRDTLKIATPTYLDIGAADPIVVNNTYLFYTQGSHGVLVEPNPTYVESLRAVRPRDVAVGAGIGAGEAREADYYVIKGKPMLNTFSPEEADRRTRDGRDVVERVVKMPLVPIMEVIDKHFQAAPDLISIDAEGMDLAIVQSLDLDKYRPPVICAETKGPAYTHEGTALARYLTAKNYLVTAGTIYNTILVDRARVS